MNKWFESFWNILFPTTCITCSKQGPDLCRTCIASLTFAKPTNYTWITSMWDYRDPYVTTIMRTLKNHPNRRLCSVLMKTIINHHSNLKQREFVIVPVPIHRTRFQERGFNQSLLLAEEYAKHTQQKLFPHVLYKKHQTHKQGTLTSKQSRLHNLQNSFAVRDSSKIKNQHVLIIDDITTTGTTLVELQKTLVAAGAKSVSALTVAN